MSAIHSNPLFFIDWFGICTAEAGIATFYFSRRWRGALQIAGVIAGIVFEIVGFTLMRGW
jgi:hypothetical protein